jgi:hypothetical protein
VIIRRAKRPRSRAPALGAYSKLRRKRRAFRLHGVFWYSWGDKDGGDQVCARCGHAGLRNPDGSAKPAWDTLVRMASG